MSIFGLKMLYYAVNPVLLVICLITLVLISSYRIFCRSDNDLLPAACLGLYFCVISGTTVYLACKNILSNLGDDYNGNLVSSYL